jgi:glutamate--cysteine ligase
MATCARILLKNRLLEKRELSHEWLENRFRKSPADKIPFYASFDLRDADYKVAPVDANLFPAGFNNICADDLAHSPDVIEHTFSRILGRVPDSMVIVPENHTRNAYYAENLYELRQIFRNAGIRSEIGWVEGDSTKESAIASDGLVHLQTPEGHEVTAIPLSRQGTRLVAGDLEPEVIIINNDFSSGLPSLFDDIKQPVFPNPDLGWHSRRKDRFFHHYNRLVHEYSQVIGIDPWAFTVETVKVGGVNFSEEKGLDALAEETHQMIERLKLQYKEHCRDQKPFVFIKNNAGTYGIGVMKVNDASELKQLNRRDKNKMSVGKGNAAIEEVIVQEGIPTRFMVEGTASEPVIYMMGTELLGGFLRKNPQRGQDENLNSRGMVFQKLCIADLKREADRDLELELVYGTLSRIAAAALVEELINFPYKKSRPSR